MSISNVSNDLRSFIGENFLFEEYTGDNDDSFLESGVLDSTGILELIYFLEDSYGIKVDDAEMIPENLDSITNITHFIQNKFKNGI